jgi:hypothetical protein
MRSIETAGLYALPIALYGVFMSTLFALVFLNNTNGSLASTVFTIGALNLVISAMLRANGTLSRQDLAVHVTSDIVGTVLALAFWRLHTK